MSSLSLDEWLKLIETTTHKDEVINEHHTESFLDEKIVTR